ncbi:MAG: BBP7 family outer membrane beta-barrel protein [Thermoguttaceae bacterium]
MKSRNLLGTLSCALLVLAASSAAALDQNDPADCRLVSANGEDSPPPFSQTLAESSPCAGCGEAGCWQPYCCPQWTVAAGFIILDRIGGTNQALVTKSPPLSQSNTVVLTGNDFQQGFAAGPSVDLIHHGDCGYDWEFSFFQIGGWNSDRTITTTADDWKYLTMSCPAHFQQTNQIPGQAMAWDYSSQLYNAELNVRWNPSSQVTMLAGFRWVNLGEKLTGALDPPSISWEAPFWNATTINNLYGLQVGADWKFFARGRFSIDALVKTGLYDNDAEETTGVSVIAKQVRAGSATTNHAAFVGETGLLCKYQVSERLLLKAGYEAIWLEGVALAPGQIQETYVTLVPKMTAQALGVNCNSGVFYHGATAGLEYSF